MAKEKKKKKRISFLRFMPAPESSLLPCLRRITSTPSRRTLVGMEKPKSVTMRLSVLGELKFVLEDTKL
jgi:hypothetical protein